MLRILVWIFLSSAAGGSVASASVSCDTPTAKTFAITKPTLVQDSDPKHYTYLEQDGCVETGLATGYYTGNVTNVFFDTDGNYLGSNGQPLVDSTGQALRSGDPHRYGAGLYLDYPVADGKVLDKVLVEATILPCTSAYTASCATTGTSYLWQSEDSGATAPPPSKDPVQKRTCATPVKGQNAEAHPGQTDGDAQNGSFRLYAQGLMRIADDTATGTTAITLTSCLRFMAEEVGDKGAYVVTARATFFDTNGNVLGIGTPLPGVAGQQLNSITVPPDILPPGITFPILNARYRDSDSGPPLMAGFHDFGVTVSVPATSHANIDPHVLIAATLLKCDAAGDCTTLVFYRLLDTCSPDRGVSNPFQVCPSHKLPAAASKNSP